MNKPEWMVNEDNPWEQLKCEYAQRKLLEYLIQRNIEADMKGITAMVGNRTLKEMLKQLEAKNEVQS